MTVCVAALCDNRRTIIGVSDRMLTSRNIETESLSKSISMTYHISAMVAGSPLLHSDIIHDIRKTVVRDPNEPTGYDWDVKDIADFYRDTYIKIRDDRIEKEVLQFYALDLETWRTRQSSLSPSLIDNVLSRIEYLGMPDVETIIAGIDKTGAHLFVVKNDKLTCHDMLGYACIGIGADQAESEFIFRGHNSEKGFAEASLTAFTAKKRAEVISGVGGVTDLLCLYTDTDTSMALKVFQSGFVGTLEMIYRRQARQERDNKIEAMREVLAYVEQISEREKSVTTETETIEAAKATENRTIDERELSNGSETS